ncbi:molybdopterin-dependent oxidoreductase [Myxococcota bacterium]|nr:molybdopterin-dependent oxidoreductase [Myxococcota bacterium]
MPLSRRSFIKISSATLGTAAAGGALASRGFSSSRAHGQDPGTEGDRVVPTFCELCFWNCGVLAHVKDGTVTKIEGNPAHPLSRGKLCPRGTGGTGLLYDPDRLRSPLLRTNVRGSQEFKPVSWEAALDEVAGKLIRMKEQYGPEALALYSHGYGGSWFKTLMSAYGSANIAAPSFAQCRGSREVAFELTYGMGAGSPEWTDIENSRVLTLIGSHLGENMHNTQVQDLARAIERGAQLVVVDPRYSVAAGKARYWLPIKPGTDIALLLAWMHVIVQEQLYDRDYLERYAVGFEELKAHLADKTPQWAFARTGIAAETIVETARFIAGGRPGSLIHPGRRTAWYGDDTQRGRAIAILNALLGAWGREGGFFLPAAMPIPAHPHPPYAHKPRPAPVVPGGQVFPFASSTLAHGQCHASIPGTADYDIKGWLVYGTNLVQALPEESKTIQAIQALDLLVAIDVLPSEIVGWADVVLPEATYLERYDDLHAPPWREPYVAIRQPVVDPMYDTRPGWWIAKQLGERLGLGAYFPFEDVEQYLAERTEAAGIDLVELAKTGVIEGPKVPVTIEQGVQPTFPTPSGRIELYSQQMADAGLPPLPDFTAHEEPGPDQFRLLFGRAPMHTFGRTTNNAFLGRVMAENVLWLNARRAQELGLAQDELVTLVNQDGVRSPPIKVMPTERIRPDCVYMVHGFGHDAKGLSFGRNRGVNDTQLVTRVAIDPAMGGTGMNVNFVRIERAVA